MRLLFLVIVMFYFSTPSNGQGIDNGHYENLLIKYRQHQLAYEDFPLLAQGAKQRKEGPLADSVGQDFIDNYLSNKSDEVLFTKMNIGYITRFNKRSGNKPFRFIYTHATKVDSLMGVVNYSQHYIDYIIAREEVDAKLWRNLDVNQPIADNPDWHSIAQNVTRKYNPTFSERIVLNAQIRWYDYKRDSAALLKYTVEKWDRYGIDTAGINKFLTNNSIYALIFRWSNDKSVLKKGIRWTEQIMALLPDNPGVMDTYANLLYKTGRKEDALRIEQKAFTLARNDKSIEDSWNKMQQDKPTWKTN